MSDYITFKLWKAGAFLVLVVIYNAIQGWREGTSRNRPPEQSDKDTGADSGS